MAIQPWAIDGAKLTAAQARSMAFKATSGARGVTLPNDLKVVPLPSPGGGVRVMPGGATLPNDYPGGTGQSYGTLMVQAEDVAVPATGSSGGKTSYLIQRITDPEYSGQPPADPLNYRYDPFVLVSSISNLAYPYVPLARINQPANTPMITQAMIEDIREVANPRTKPEMRTYAMLSADTETLTTTGSDSTTGETWPRQADTSQVPIKIPSWATHMRILMMWSGVLNPSAAASGRLWLQVGGDGNPDSVKTQTIKYSSGVGSSRSFLMVPDTLRVPAGLRGTAQKFIPRGNRASGSGALTLDGSSAVAIQVEFIEQAE